MQDIKWKKKVKIHQKTIKEWTRRVHLHLCPLPWGLKWSNFTQVYKIHFSVHFLVDIHAQRIPINNPVLYSSVKYSGYNVLLCFLLLIATLGTSRIGWLQIIKIHVLKATGQVFSKQHNRIIHQHDCQAVGIAYSSVGLGVTWFSRFAMFTSVPFMSSVVISPVVVFRKSFTGILKGTKSQQLWYLFKKYVNHPSCFLRHNIR